MSKRLGKLLLAGVLICSLAPLAMARRRGCGPRDHCKQVPEGGSAVVYLLGAGATCFGAMFLKIRVKPAQS